MKRQGKKKSLILTLGTTSGFLLCSIMLLAAYLWEEHQEAKAMSAEIAVDDRGTVFQNGSWYDIKDDMETVLLLGVDKFAGENIQPVHGKYEQADFILLLAVDTEQGSCAAIHLNRDIMTEITQLSDAGREIGSFQGQLALAHTYGGDSRLQCRNTVEAVSRFLYETPIDHYVSFYMDGIPVLNDLAGGVELEILDDLSGVDETLVKGERVLLKGQQALTYVRARRGIEDSSNLRRMKRQQQYLSVLQGNLLQKAEEEGFIDTALPALQPYLESDCSVEELLGFIEMLKDCGGVDIYLTIPGKAVEGEKYMEYHADEEALRELVIEVFYEQTGE